MNNVIARCGVGPQHLSGREEEDGGRGKRRVGEAPSSGCLPLIRYQISYPSSSGLSFCLLFLFTTPNSTTQSIIAYRPPIEMRVRIKEWNAVASWRWDMPEDEVCGICRVQFDGTCPTCKFPGDDCSLCMPSQQSNESAVLIVYQ
jgi:hypothetical protein